MSINFNYNYPQMARDAGFKLRQYKDGPLDWRLLGSLEVERILQDQRLEQIDGVLPHLSEAPLASLLDTNILDSGIAKYFILSQYAIQYLLFCRKFLDETVKELRDAHAESQLDVAKLRKSLSEANNEILQLHKKITQIEAIHEVVYPCHLCSKSFISNEALNIHIGRRHAARAGGTTMTDARRNDTPASAPKEREHNDLNLINTIKLELEIKQLKERLNNAERDIRDRSAANSKRNTPREVELKREMCNIGIQSNLIETKEQDDESSKDDSEIRERKQQLAKLQEKIHDFEQWRELQQVNNEESIAEINKKLTEIVQALEASKLGQPKQAEQPVQMVAEANLGMERRVSPSVEDLERLLTEKVAEIGKKSAEKLEEVVYNLEVNYKEKLHELELEIKKRNVADKSVSEENVALENEVKNVTPLNLSESDSTGSASSHEQHLKRNNIKPNTGMEDQKKTQAKASDATFEVEVPKGKVKPKLALDNEIKTIESMSSESNRTFVKGSKEARNIKGLQRNQSVDISNDSTDISESMSEHSKSDESSTETDSEQVHIATKKTEALTKTTQQEKSLDIVDQKPKETTKRRIPTQPKQCTRKDAQKLVNKRFAAHGIDMKAKTIPSASMKRITAELTENRNKLKLKNPHFYATRNKIKKLVDKLCSTKLPEHADLMLKTKKPLKPMDSSKSQVQLTSPPHSPEVSSFETLELTSTPLQARDSDIFKQRLERILASPVRQPTTITQQNLLATAQVHSAPTANRPVPVPLARKRVMFNTRNSEAQSDDINEA